MYEPALKTKKEITFGPNCEPTGQDKVLTESSIHNALFMYEPDHVYLKTAIYSDRLLHATFRFFPYPFTKVRPRHATREQAVLFLTQAAYVLGDCLLKEGLLYPLTDERIAQQLIINEQVVFTRLSLTFKKLIANSDGISVQIHCHQIRSFNNNLALEFSFQFDNSSCVGECEAYVSLDSRLRLINQVTANN